MAILQHMMIFNLQSDKSLLQSQRMDWMEEGYVTSTFDSDSDSSATSDDEVTVEDVDREVAAEPDRNSGKFSNLISPIMPSTL